LDLDQLNSHLTPAIRAAEISEQNWVLLC